MTTVFYRHSEYKAVPVAESDKLMLMFGICRRLLSRGHTEFEHFQA